MTDQLHGIQEAAKRLSISPWTVRRLVDRGHLRAVNVGRRVLISEGEILRVIRHGCGERRKVSR